MDLVLTFLRRPAISLGAGAAHQHRPLGVAQAVGLQEGPAFVLGRFAERSTPSTEKSRELRTKFARDSPLEGNGFELPVPHAMHGGLRRLSPASAASRRGSFFATAVGGHHRRRAKAKSRNRSLLIARGTGSSNSFPSTRESGEVGGSSGSVAHRYLQLHAIVRTQLGGPPTVAGFKMLILRLQPRAETMRPEGVRRPHGIVHEELPFRDGLG
jgi:hypothetical protein